MEIEWFIPWYQNEFDPMNIEHVERLKEVAKEYPEFGAALYADYFLRFEQNFEEAARWYCWAMVDGQDGDVMSYLRSLPDPTIFEDLERGDLESAIPKLTFYFERH